jgi:uncharacterized membrane protein YraQ (UPF0718 family)
VRDRTTQLLLLIVALLAALAGQRGGWKLVLDGILSGARLLWMVLPLLVAAFVIAGLIQVLVTKEMVTRWLGREAGWRGIALACVGGALMPGGPYVYYPIAAVLLQSGASLGVLVAFVTAKNLWALSRLPLEFALLGPTLTIARFVVTLVVPPLMGLLAEWLFGGFVEQIRQGVRT